VRGELIKLITKSGSIAKHPAMKLTAVFAKGAIHDASDVLKH
jgi:hypothetical protein